MSWDGWNYGGYYPGDNTIWGSLSRGLGGVAQAFADVQQRKQQQDQDAFRNLQQMLQMFPNATPEQKQQWIASYEQQAGKNKFFDRSAFHFPSTPGTPPTPARTVQQVPPGQQTAGLVAPPSPGGGPFGTFGGATDTSVPPSPGLQEGPGTGSIPSTAAPPPAPVMPPAPQTTTTPATPGTPGGFLLPSTPLTEQTFAQIFKGKPKTLAALEAAGYPIDRSVGEVNQLFGTGWRATVYYAGEDSGAPTTPSTTGGSGVPTATPPSTTPAGTPGGTPGSAPRSSPRPGTIGAVSPWLLDADDPQLQQIANMRVPPSMLDANGFPNDAKIDAWLKNQKPVSDYLQSTKPLSPYEQGRLAQSDAAAKRAEANAKRTEYTTYLGTARANVSRLVSAAESVQRKEYPDPGQAQAAQQQAHGLFQRARDYIAKEVQSGRMTREDGEGILATLPTSAMPPVQRPPAVPSRRGGGAPGTSRGGRGQSGPRPWNKPKYDAAITTLRSERLKFGRDPATGATKDPVQLNLSVDRFIARAEAAGMSRDQAQREAQAAIPEWQPAGSPSPAAPVTPPPAAPPAAAPSTPGGSRRGPQPQVAPPGGSVAPAMKGKTGPAPSPRAGTILQRYRNKPEPMPASKFNLLTPDEQRWLTREGVAVDTGK